MCSSNGGATLLRYRTNVPSAKSEKLSPVQVELLKSMVALRKLFEFLDGVECNADG